MNALQPRHHYYPVGKKIIRYAYVVIIVGGKVGYRGLN